MLAFDLDGIFLPDIVYQPETVSTVHRVRTSLLKPIFIPDQPYYIITGRPVDDREETLAWIDQFAMHPKAVFHDNRDIQYPVLYKERVLKEHDEITHYIESDAAQVAYLTDRVPCRVMLFDDLLRYGIAAGIEGK